MRDLSMGRTFLVVITAVLGLAPISCMLYAIVIPLIVPESSGGTRYGEAVDFCSIGDATIVLYEGSNGATTRMGYIVTYLTSSQDERGFFYSHAEPEVKDVQCSDSGVTLYFDQGEPQTFSVAQITGRLIKEPIRYSYGKLEPPPGPLAHIDFSAVRAGIAGVVSVVMLTLSVVLYRTGRLHPPEQV